MSHVSAEAVWTGEKLELCDLVGYKAQLRRMKLGQGEQVVVRVERKEDAVRYEQFKYFHGYILAPLVDYTGDPDWRLELKLRFLPEGKTSLTQLTHEEMKMFIEQSEAFARTNCPEAYEQYGRDYIG